MRKLCLLQNYILICSILLVIVSCSGKEENINYFDQVPPGEIPQVFAPGIISSDLYQENGCTFSPDGKEFYFSRSVDKNINIYASFFNKGKWTKPQLKFSSPGNDFEPYVSPDNTRLYYTRSNHSDSTFNSGIWYVERNGKDWTEPVFFRKGMYVSSTSEGVLYYSGMLPNGWISGDIEKTEFKEGGYSEAIEIKGDINSTAYELHPCISPDGTTLIFVSRRTQDRGSNDNFNDLYISFKDSNGVWGKSFYLGGLLGKSFKMSPYFSPDGKYLFYTSNNDIYWVSTEIIDKIKQII